MDLQGIMEQLSTRVNSISNEEMVKSSAQKVDEIDKLETQIVKKCTVICEQVEEVRTLIANQTVPVKGLTGCLRGSVDEYLEEFGSKIGRLTSKIEDDRAYWSRHKKASCHFLQ